MARIRNFDDSNNGWMITFADLMTLLLALFVLIFSMSSLDSAILQDISASVNREVPQKNLGKGEAANNLHAAAKLLMEAQDLRQQEGRIKELLFPRDLLPPGIDKGTLASSVKLEERGQGFAFVIPSSLLFEAQSSSISPAGRAVLNSMTPLMEAVPGAVQIISFYDGPPTVDLPDDYAVAGRYALATLGVFINRSADSGRLSVSAYGADRAEAGLEAGAAASRVEIVFKSARAALQVAAE